MRSSLLMERLCSKLTLELLPIQPNTVKEDEELEKAKLTDGNL